MKDLNYDTIKKFVEPYIARAAQNESFGFFSKANLIAAPFVRKNILTNSKNNGNEISLSFIITTEDVDFQLIISISYNLTNGEPVSFLSLERDTNQILQKSKEISEEINTTDPFILIDGFMSETKVIEVTHENKSIFFPTDSRFNSNKPLNRETLLKTDTFKNLY